MKARVDRSSESLNITLQIPLSAVEGVAPIATEDPVNRAFSSDSSISVTFSGGSYTISVGAPGDAGGKIWVNAYTAPVGSPPSETSGNPFDAGGTQLLAASYIGGQEYTLSFSGGGAGTGVMAVLWTLSFDSGSFVGPTASGFVPWTSSSSSSSSSGLLPMGEALASAAADATTHRPSCEWKWDAPSAKWELIAASPAGTTTAPPDFHGTQAGDTAVTFAG